MNEGKNRNRSPYTFANINLLGQCNLDCYFCLGKDLKEEFEKYNCMDKHFLEFPNLNTYLRQVWEAGIRQIYITGQNTDPLLYEQLEGFITFLKSWGFYVGIRTNGILAQKYIDVINQCTSCRGDAVAYTLLTKSQEDMYAMTQRQSIPNWDYIFKTTAVPYRVSIVITKINKPYVLDLIAQVTKYKYFNNNLRYCQLRKISTDYRHDELKEDIEAFGEIAIKIKSIFPQKGEYEGAEIFDISGLDIVLWRTTATTANSMNYFVNGVISDKYFIIEGYEANKGRIL